MKPKEKLERGKNFRIFKIRFFTVKIDNAREKLKFLNERQQINKSLSRRKERKGLRRELFMAKLFNNIMKISNEAN